MSGSRQFLLDPTAKPKPPSLKLASRPADIKGMTVGFLDNGWWSFGVFIDRTQRLLMERYGVRGGIHLKKFRGEAASKEKFEELAAKCQFIINGLCT